MILFITTKRRNKTIPREAILNVAYAALNDLSCTLLLLSSAFSAKTKTTPTEMVTANFTTTKAGRFVFTKPAIMGLSSCVPKYRVPITVVKQSIEPIRISIKLAVYLTADKNYSSAEKPSEPTIGEQATIKEAVL
jgi:hypothetical protein